MKVRALSQTRRPSLAPSIALILSCLVFSGLVASAAPNVGGKVFREFEVNGQADVASTKRHGDLPLAGVNVQVFGEDGILVGSATTGSGGDWSVDVAAAPGSNVLVEFEIPSGFKPGPEGADNSSAVVVVPKGAAGINFTVAKPSDHSEDDPALVASCFVTSTAAGEVTLVAVQYGDTKDYGATLTGGSMGQDDYPQKHYATNRSLYASAQKTVLSTLATNKNISGIAWNRRNSMIYGGVYHKWQVEVNIGEMGKIFATDISGGAPVTMEWLDLHTVFGSDVTGTYAGTNTAQDKAAVGLIGITDVEISEDARTLYVYNAKTLQVYAIPIAEDGSAAVTTAGDIKTFQIPRPASGTFTSGGQALSKSASGGLGVNSGRVYATATVTGPTLADMKGVLYSFDAQDDPSTALVAVEFEVDYSGWQGYDVLISGGLYGSGGVTQMAPWRAAHPVNEFSPWLFDVAFDIDAVGETRMTLGTRNRSHEVIDPDELYVDPTRGGYAHRAFQDGSGWVLESGGSAGSLLTGLNQSGGIYARSQPGARFYHNEGVEGPSLHGTFAVVPGFKEVAGLATDSMYGDWDSGVTFRDLSNGLRTRDNNIIYGVNEGYAKGLSWGDLEAISEAPPLQIGNYVWTDDGDGVQEAGEAPVAGATVNLYLDANGNGKLDTAEAATAVASTTTDSMGRYLFDLDDGLDYYTDYILTMNHAADYASGSLVGFLPTAANAAASDNLDSDAVDQGAGFPEIAVRVGNFGETDHSYDFGFIQTVSVGNLVWIDLNGDGDVDPGEPGLAGATVSLCLADGVTPASDTSGQLVPAQVTGSDGGYLFSGLADGDYVLKVTPPAGFTATTPAAQPDPDLDSTDGDSNTTSGGSTVQTPPFTLTQNGETPGDEDGDGSTYTDLTVDFGFVPNAVMVGNYVWNDANGDGSQAGESGLAGAVVELFLSTGLPAVDTTGGPVPFQTTGADGAYLFSGLPDGEYFVRVTAPANYVPTVAGGDPDTDSSDTDSNGVLQGNGKVESPAVNLAAGTESGGASNNLEPAVDFGFVFVPFSVACAVVDDNGGTLQPTDTATYTLQVSNNSGSPISDLVVTSAVPTGATYVGASVSVTGGSGSGGAVVYGFESGMPAGWTKSGASGGTDWEFGAPATVGPAGSTLPSGAAVAGTDLDAIHANGISNLCLTTEIFDFSTAAAVQVNFDEWLEIEGDGFDYVRFERKLGTGAWTTVFTTNPGGGRVDSAWSQVDHDATSYAAGQSSVQWRWCLISDGSVQNAGWYLDDFTVETATFAVSDSFDFESGMPAGWTKSGASGGTDWEFGAPATVGPAGSTLPSGTAVAGTDLDAIHANGISNLCLTTEIFDFSVAAGVQVNFDEWLEIEGDGFDYVRFERKVGTGAWTTVFTTNPGGGRVDTAWSQVDHDATSYAAGQSSVQWRWCLISDGSVQNAGWYLDDFTVETATFGGGSLGNPPPNILTAGDAVTLNDGETLTITYQVMVDLVPGVNELTSTSTFAAAGTGSITCSLVSPLDLPGVDRDYADAPDTGSGTGAANYNTLATDNGPSHIIDTDLKIGAELDGEDGDLQDATASADDGDQTPDDEDGVSAGELSSLRATLPASVDVTVTNTTGSGAILYGWIDFNANGVFEISERAYVSVPDATSGGTVVLDFGNVPADAASSTFARFRLSTDTVAADPTGAASDGEVEDYAVTIFDAPLYDYGDLPDIASGSAAGEYQTRIADGGARHIVVAGLMIGADVDDELNGASSIGADADDGARRDDEDGVVVSDLSFLEDFAADVRVGATNTTGAPATLYGFIDWDNDGAFSGTNETASILVASGSNDVEFTLAFGNVPVGAVASPYARFRLSTDSAAAAASGTASDGEVEDYRASVTVPDFDLGDAADTGGSTYDTLIASDGPRHVLGANLVIGTEVDADIDGQQSPNADGDDNLGTADEDGVSPGLTLVELGSGLVSVTVNNPLSQVATLYGWIDFNDDGVFDNGTERASVSVPPGTNGLVDLDFGTVASGITGTHVMRVRLSTDGSAANPTGAALDGEVEDHLVVVAATSYDFGDAPDTGAGDYDTLLASGGPQHVLANGLKIGNQVDAEADGAQSADALGDDSAGSPDDEDGLTVTLMASGNALFEVAVNNPLATDATLYGWIDFDGDGVFGGGAETTSATVLAGTAGTAVLDFGTVPSAAVASTFLRLRLSTDAAASTPGGLANDGEVEDHVVSIDPAIYDFADAPDTGPGTGPGNYNTLDADSGPSHVLSNGIKLGISVDDETDAYASSGADGDDTDGSDDENGVTAAIDLNEGLNATLEVAVMNPIAIDAVLYGWIDFNGNGEFEVGERASVLVPAGTNGTVDLDFGDVPAGSVTATFARLRLSSDDTAASAPTGPAFDGEVEDYPVTITVPQFDYGDAPSADGYETLLADNGARHLLAGNNLYIGAEVDSETDGDPNSTATGDDVAGSPDDEDGISGTLVVREGTFDEISVPVTNGSGIDAVLWTWIDYDGDGDFEIAERFRTAVPDGTTSASPVTVSLGVIPAGSAGNTFLRFRLSTDGSLNTPSGAAGTASDGEIEDHPVTIDPPQYDFGDADATYGTSGATTGANHTLLDDGLMIGSTVDDEADGQPTSGATGDGADEDGLGALTLNVGGSGLVAVTVENPTPSGAILFGWIDFDNSGTFEPGERASVSVPDGTVGDVILDFGTIPSGFTGTTTARLRLSSAPPAGSPFGNAVGGEVEDHQVTITVPTYDWGDAPDPSYATLNASDGPNHIITPDLKIGAATDNESDGQPNGSATGDGSDEDGVNTADLSMNIGLAADVRVTATNNTGAPGTLHGWIDFNADGIFDNATERAQITVPTGSTAVEFTLPFGSVPSGASTGTTFARFRLSTDSAASDPTGEAGDGEIEDYSATIANALVYDYGDAPDAGYSTLNGSSGPRHALGSDVYLGALVDAEPDGIPNADADGDDSGGDADEDGVNLSDLVLVHNDTVLVNVTATNESGSPATLYGWIDIDGDGTFETSDNIAVPSGTTVGGFQLDFGSVGTGFTGQTYARFRISTQAGVSSPTGSVSDGEVEDHLVTISAPPEFDYGDAPDPGYATLESSGGPNHELGATLKIGALVDSDDGTQQNSTATADTPDEDGIVTGSQLTMHDRQTSPGIDVTVMNSTGQSAILYGWIDFDGDGSFDNATERALVSVPDTTNGVVTLTFPDVPDTATADTGGASFLRLRLSTDTSGASNPTGSAADGEVEDHAVVLVPALGIGNLVFIDNNGDGDFDDSTDTPAGDVTVQLFAAGDDPSVAAPVDSAVTDSNGCYLLLTPTAGDYFVHIPAAEFGSGGDLNGLTSTNGVGGDDGADDQAGENGIDVPNPSVVGVSSTAVNLAAGSEPVDATSEIGKAAAADNTADSNIDLTVDFGFVAPSGAGIGNKIFADTDRDGILDGGESGIDGVLVELFAAGDDPLTANPVQSTVTTDGGSYYFSSLPDGSYFVHVPPSNFGSGSPLESLLSSAGNGGDDGSDDDAGENGVDTVNPSVTGVSSTAIALATGTEGSESGSGGGADNGFETDNDLSVDMGFVAAGVGIGNLVFRDGNQDGDFDPSFEAGVDGVTVELYLSSAGPGTGSPIATTETADGGCYLFTGLAEDSYVVHIPAAEFGSGGTLLHQESSNGAGSDTTTDDSGDENGIDPSGGEATDGVTSNVFALALGAEPTDATTEDGKGAAVDDGANDGDYNLTADFGFTGKATNFPQWQDDFSEQLGANDAPFDNPDGDLYDNVLEFALCDHPLSGVNAKPFCVGLGGSTGTSGTVDAFFTRVTPAPYDLTYTLMVAPSIGSPSSWTPSTASPVIVDNGDGTETVTYPDLEAQFANGIARLEVLFGGESHFTPTFGWSTVSAQAECETVSNPYAPKEVFSGTIDDGTTATLDLTTSAGSGDISAQMAARPHYIEIVNGTCEGHRFDVLSATADSITLDTTSARNTLSPIPDLSGEQITLRPHNVLDDVATAEDFVDSVTPSNNDGPATAGRLLFYDSVNGWSTYFAYNNSGALSPAIWTSGDNSGLENVGNAVLSGDPDDMLVIVEPCAGFFAHSKAQAVDLLMVGIVREWDFACPLNAGYNFVGSGYPEDQSPNDRDMSDIYFLGTTDPATADQIEFWMSDGAISGVDAYESHFRVDCGDYMHWTTQENSSLATEDAIEMFKIQRAAFINSRDGNLKTKAGAWTWPVPWAP